MREGAASKPHDMGRFIRTRPLFHASGPLVVASGPLVVASGRSHEAKNTPLPITNDSAGLLRLILFRPALHY